MPRKTAISAANPTGKPIAAMTPDERRTYQRIKKEESDARNTPSWEESARKWNSEVEVSKKDAEIILANERGIRSKHVIDTVLQLAELAAAHHQIPFNRHIFTHGLRATLKAHEERQQQVIEVIEDKLVDGEVIHNRDAWALWDASMWREPGMIYEAFLIMRRIAKSDAFLLGKEILGKDFHEQPHQIWRDFFPKFDPVGLKPGYTQEDLKKWLAAQDQCKTFNLVASRSAYKSSFAVVWIVGAICCLPSVKILICTETKPLARGFLRSVRSYFEVTDVRNPTRFQQLMPEFCIPAGEGSELTFECPADHLRLIESTVEATSMDSAAAGRRAHVLHCDDPLSNLTVGNPEQIAASISKYDLLTKLIEPGGYATMCSTPWHPQDLTATLIQRADESDDGSRKYRLDPAWKVKPGSRGKKVEDLKEEDVDLLFPSRLTFEYLARERKASAKNGYKFFRSQNLVEFLDLNGDTEEAKLQFEELALRNAVISDARMPREGEVYAAVDIATSVSAKADRSSIAVVKVVVDPLTKEYGLVVLDVIAGRFRSSELAYQIVKMNKTYHPRTVRIERSPAFDLLEDAIRREGMKYSTFVPIWPSPITNTRNAKFERIKLLETLIAQGRLHFLYGEYIEELFGEFKWLDGRTAAKSRSSSLHDDMADSVSLAEIFLPKSAQPDNYAMRKVQKEQDEAMARQKQYNRIFEGLGENYQPITPAPVEAPRSTDPRGRYGIPGLRL